MYNLGVSMNGSGGYSGPEARLRFSLVTNPALFPLPDRRREIIQALKCAALRMLRGRRQGNPSISRPRWCGAAAQGWLSL